MQRGQLFSFGGVTDIESNKRSDKIHSLWFDIPSLREMAWQAMQHYLPDIENVSISYYSFIILNVFEMLDIFGYLNSNGMLEICNIDP